jgi:hypothetical protein
MAPNGYQRKRAGLENRPDPRRRRPFAITLGAAI